MDLITITPRTLGDDEAVQTVDARELHAVLGVGRDFSNWIKDRIAAYDFVEGHDYTLAFGSPVLANQSGRGGDRRSVSYFLGLDMAKELAMVERTDIGKRVRRYFLDCERRAKAAVPGPTLTIDDLLANPGALLALSQGYAQKVIVLEQKVAEDAHKVDAHDALMDSKLLRRRPRR